MRGGSLASRSAHEPDGFRGCGAASDLQVLLPLAPLATDGGVLEGRSSGDAPAQIADRIRSHQYCSWYFAFIENTSFRVTRRVQARVPRKHATYRRYRTARTDTGLRCGAWRGVATNDHTKGVSLYLPRPTAGLRHVCMCIQACSCADGQAASTPARLHRAVRTAQGGAGLHSRCHLRRCKRQGAAPRSWRPRSQEQKLWSARGEAGAAARRGRRRADDMASQLRPGRGRTGWKEGPREGPGRKGV